LWTVTGPAAVTYAGGTNASSTQPQFVFPQSGTYTITLTITNSSCSATTAPQSINVDAPPNVSLSPDFAVCGTNLAYNFGPAPGSTQTTISGIAQALANTYAWTVTGNNNYSFIGGTSSSSEYPQIQFTAYGVYKVSVTVQNSCGTVTKSQNITFQNAPTVTLIPSSLNICPGSPVTLTGSITPSTGTTFQWIGAGIFSASGSLITNYTPSVAEINAHSATVKLVVQTGLTGTCSQIVQTVTINIYPINTITSSTTKTICTGNPVNYNLTSVVGGSTFTWTAAITLGTATGVTASGSGAIINDTITNTDPVNNAVVTYTITPEANGCAGTQFTFKVTVKPDPVATATPANNTICSGSTGLIDLSSNIPGTKYTWTSTIQAGALTGNTQQAIATSNISISDVLTNTGNSLATVIYTITPFNGNCQGTPVIATINVQPLPTPANPGTDAELCSITTYPLNGNAPTTGAGKWTVSPFSTVTFSDYTKPNAVALGLVPGTTYVFTWTITVPNCQASSNSVTIKDDLAPVGGTTTGTTAICSGNNGGTINLTGQLGNIVRWEESIDNGLNWQTIANTTASLQYANLTTTTQYRAVVQNGVCPPANSSVAIITVNPPAIQAIAGPNDEVCNAITYPLQGNSPGSGAGKWTLTSGQTGVTFADATQFNTTVSGLVPGNSYNFTWTITPLAPCTPTSSSVTIKDDAAPIGGTTAGSTSVCSGSGSGTIALTGELGNVIRWEESIDNGLNWQTIANTTASLQYTNLTTTTQYRAVVQNGVCPPANSSVAIITVNPPAIQAIAGPNDEVCNAITYPLQGNNPGSGAGKWTLTSGQTGVTFADATLFNTKVSGLVPGNSYDFTWTITPLAPCTPTFSSVTIKDDPATVGGTTTGNAIVCGGANSGTIILSGQVGSIIRWEQSTDNGISWQIIVNTNPSQQYLNLTTTTQYRTVVQSNICLIQYSTVTTIDVNPPTPQADAGNDQNLCGAVSTTLQANNPLPLSGTWTQTSGPAAIIVSPDNYQTVVNGLIPGSNYAFVWTIHGQAPCVNSSSAVQIFTAPDIIPSFTADKNTGCGSYTVNFTNTSTSTTGATFLWDFGDGSAPSNSVNPSHTFLPRADGKDTTYKVSLSILNNCFQRPPFIVNITVRPSNPVATILPENLKGCSPFVLTVKNTSPGTNISYVFYLYDGSTLIQQINKTDKSDAVFDAITTNSPKTYTVYMVATGNCNNTAESTHVPINVSPSSVTAQMFIENDINKGCVPLNVTFTNNSSGGDNFYYTIYNKDNYVLGQFTAGKENFTYTFSNVGTYYVSLTGSDNCSTNESPKTRIDIYPVPQPLFDADVKSGCNKVLVNFTNLTADAGTAPASSLSYLWDFGDGTRSTNFNPPTHIYTHRSLPYTVMLTATNPATDCSNIVVKQSFITVSNPPGTEFTVKPDTIISIPYYQFAFVDGTTGSPTSWNWTFGDGASSTRQSPGHTYADTGVYKVTLTTANILGCDSTVSHIVRITGVPGQLFLPNAFEPTGLSTELRTFKAKGSGIKEWHMQIFNNYAQLVWETTLLSEKGEPVNGWDGTFKGAPAPQGVYVWQVSATFINGTDWKGNVMNNSAPKRVGVVHLIR
jgi:large repetitive protein